MVFRDSIVAVSFVNRSFIAIYQQCFVIEHSFTVYTFIHSLPFKNDLLSYDTYICMDKILNCTWRSNWAILIVLNTVVIKLMIKL